DLLAESRKYQSEVSNRLADQVLGALWELLRGFQAADEAANGRVLYGLPHTDPQQIYGGQLTVIMRLVFLLYAEDQGLMPDDPVYARNYAIGGLFERLREDAGRYPDTMDQRFGAYAWLLSTFRMVFDGGGHGGLHLPTRHGQLFNPDEYPFLEGRPPAIHRVMGETFEAPRVSDGVVWRVLEGLLMLDGERLSYRALDVEQVGSVYESMMGFDVATLPGRAIAVRPKHVVIDLDALLAVSGSKRAAWLKEHAECDLAAGGARELAEAATADDVVAALGRKVAPQTPRPLAPGALFLQPGEERRRSGSHYTPRELTEPIVRTTLRPVLEALGPKPTPEQILELKVCDPAMGSGAFLVEACRQLAAALVAAWEAHGSTPKLPPDEDPLLHARRLVAQRCLYGVDKNRFAVNLAKLSLWLVTLARDHAFTFLDHALKHGDSLVGLTKAQIGAFHWSPLKQGFGPLFTDVTTAVNEVHEWRRLIHAVDEGDYDQRRAAWREAEDVVHDVRLIGDACVAAYFGAEKDKDREALLREHRWEIDRWQAGGERSEIEGIVAELRDGERPVPPLHWEIEFPEVFGRVNPGFDAMVGNPPFAGKNTTINANRPAFLDWLKEVHAESHGNADLVGHFFRRAFTLARERGTFGLIATNTIGQGDTRGTGLRWIGQHGGEIYAATRRVKWPGLAAVVVSVVHVHRGRWTAARRLDGREVSFISAFLFHGGGHDDPHALRANEGKSFQGSIVLGMGFTFDDTDKSGAASSLDEMHRLIQKD
ncbi:MAG: N-6 DNA methylase, partial [Deltaproteobacteria bacterium]|nr:N-6 DNA methylase [Deltaproteobacteria bacterium]